MKNEIKAYGEAFEAHHQAMKAAMDANLLVRKTRQALHIAKNDLWAKERDIIESAEAESLKKQ